MLFGTIPNPTMSFPVNPPVGRGVVVVVVVLGVVVVGVVVDVVVVVDDVVVVGVPQVLVL
jgi:hypothetical protein